MTALAYMRVSGAGQADGDGFDRQRLAIERFAASKGMAINGWYQDVQTGKDEWQERAGWTAMLSALNGTRTILVEKLDRVARRVLVQELILADLRKRDVALLTSTGEDSSDDDPERVLFRQVLASFAEYERASIVLKLRGARQRKKDETGRCEGRKPYGHKPGEREILDRIHADALSGASIRAIADHLNAAGIQTRYGRPWRASTIAKLLERQ
jgi:DNA invertase Pin-like site-specific DNA recombinase